MFKVFSAVEVLLLCAPPAIVAVMALLFSLFGDVSGPRRGYLAGFAVYWAAWCFGFPVLVLGASAAFSTLLVRSIPTGAVGAAVVAALVVPPLLAGLTVFRRRLAEASARILLVSAALAVINGVGEELLWRGAYVQMFRDNPILAILYPALGFALWHLAPLILRPARNPGGAPAFVFGALCLGLLWGWVAFVTGSIGFTIVSHVLTDFLGLGGFAYLAAQPDGRGSGSSSAATGS